MGRTSTNWTLTEIESLIAEAPGIYTAQICRCMNGGRISPLWCGRCKGYANPRKRASKILHRPCQRINFPRVQYYLRRLIATGAAMKRREWRPDHYQNRLIDYMSCYYLAGQGMPALTQPKDFLLPIQMRQEATA